MQIAGHAKSIIEQNLSAMSTLAKVAQQDIALRRSHESSAGNDATCSSTKRGNFLELVDLVKSESSNAKASIGRLPKNANYCSKDSQNDLLHSVAIVINKKA